MIDPISLASLSYTRGVGEDLQAGNPAEANKAGASGPTFGEVLKDAAYNTIQDVKEAENATQQGIMGTMSHREVVDAVMGAERSLKTALALRDKLVSAYLDITKMPI